MSRDKKFYVITFSSLAIMSFFFIGLSAVGVPSGLGLLLSATAFFLVAIAFSKLWGCED